MGLDAYLEDEFGEELDSFIDDGGALAALIPTGDAEYPMLRYADVEGTTSFNRLQLAVVVPELERLAAVKGHPEPPEPVRLTQARRLLG